MSTSPPRRLWQLWKGLKLPWRKKYLVGTDLAGNTFWELYGASESARPRRLVKPVGRVHLSDVQMSPQWLQWLRRTREDAPSLQEQRADLQRQTRLKQLARVADERWASKPSLLDGPELQNPAPLKRTGSYPPVADGSSTKRGAPGEDWRPRGWNPSAPRS